MKHGRRITAALMTVCLILGTVLTGCGSKNAQGTAADETPLAHLGEETISLEEAVFYTRMMQEQWEYTYYEYYGKDMWQEELDKETGSLSDALKRDVLDALTEIHLLCAHAEEYQVELTEEDRNTISRRAEAFMEDNTPEVLEAAGATKDTVEAFLLRNQLAREVADAVMETYEPEVDEELARVGKLTYVLFATTGIFDAEGNQTPFTAEELEKVKKDAETFAIRAQELGDIAAAGEEVAHTVIDVYFNSETDGGAHELVAEAARQMKTGEVSGIIETEEGYYIVQRVSEYDADSTEENIRRMIQQARADYLTELEAEWSTGTPLELDEALWDTVKVDRMLTEPPEPES